MFKSNSTTKVLSALLVLALLLPLAIFILVWFVWDHNYVHNKKIEIIQVADLDSKSITGNNYVALENFCVDSIFFEYSTIGRSEPVSYYLFVNNFCDSINGPIVIVELNREAYSKYTSSNSSEDLFDVFSGRLYKGYQSKNAPYLQMKKAISSGNIYTLQSGISPNKILNRNMIDFYLASFVCLIMSIVFLIAIYKNKNR